MKNGQGNVDFESKQMLEIKIQLNKNTMAGTTNKLDRTKQHNEENTIFK